MNEVSQQWRHLKGSLQALRIHALRVAPPGVDDMEQPGADQHESGVAVRKAARYTSAATDLPVQPFNVIVGADTSPVFAGKTTSSMPSSTSFAASCSFMERRSSATDQVYFTHRLRHTKALVPDNEFYSARATATQPFKEIDPADLVSFHALCCAKRLAIAVLVGRNKLPEQLRSQTLRPSCAQIDPIHIDTRIP